MKAFLKSIDVRVQNFVEYKWEKPTTPVSEWQTSKTKVAAFNSKAMNRDGNFCPTREYPAWPDPNGSGFTQSDKEQGRVWVFFKNPKRVRVLIKTQQVPDPTRPGYILKY